jgi:serine/threonine-protein kinase
LIALLALVAGAIVLFNVLQNKKDNKGTEFPLPNVVGLPLDEAGKILQDDNHLVLKLQEEPTPGIAEGLVIRTDPAADTLVLPGREIIVVYNPVKAPVPIPQVQGQTVEEATATLSAAGFTVSPDTVFVTSQDPPNTVISTNPPFGQSAKQGTAVILTVSKAPDQVSVPEVTGLASDAAKAMLEAEPYTFVVAVTSEPSTDKPVNTVLRTDPAVNTPVAKGSNINLIVSAGPAKVRVPPVEGLTEAAARNQLTQRGLVANVVYFTLAPGSAQDGIVISQSIPSSETVLPGTTIRLQVGKAAPAPTTTTTTTTIPATTTTAAPSADLSVIITHTTSTGSVTFKVTATNTGPSTANSASLIDNTTGGASNVSWSCASSGGANCPSSGSGTGNINTSVDLPPGGSVVFTVVATASSGTFLTNNATISVPSGVNEAAPSNNSANDTGQA